jgi:hypothetical protein
MNSQGCYELDGAETDSDNESHSGSEDGEQEPVGVVIAVVVEPASIPLPPSPPVSPIPIPIDVDTSEHTETVEPIEPSVIPESDPVMPIESTTHAQIGILDQSPLLTDGATTAPPLADSEHIPIDAQLGVSIDALHSVPDIHIDSNGSLQSPTQDAIVIPTPAADDAQVVDLPTTTQDGDSSENKDGDEAEACCGRPTLSKIDKGKGREVLIDPTSSSTEPISTSTPTPIPTSESTEQSNETVCTPPTPSSRTRRSRRDKERGHRPKYQPILTIRSSHGWLWNQVHDLLITMLYRP